MNNSVDLTIDDTSTDDPTELASSGFAAEQLENSVESDDAASRPSSVADTLLSIPVTLQVVIGTARLSISRIAELKRGAVVNLDQKLGTPVTILINGKEIARGDLFVQEGEEARLGITIREVISVSKR